MEENKELEEKVEQEEEQVAEEVKENEEPAETKAKEKKKKADYRILEFKPSSTGRFAAVKISSHTEAGDEFHALVVFNVQTGSKVFEQRESSITHFEWHPVYNKLLYIGVLSGLNAVDIVDDGSKNPVEGVVKHSVLFLEFFHFSPKGKSAAYLLRDISVIPQSAELEEKNIRDIILDEEKAQLLFYEKADVSERIEGLGRAWNWLDDDTIIYNYQDEIFIKDIVWGSKKIAGKHLEFVMDFIPWRKKVLLVSIDYKNLLTQEGNFKVFLLDPNKSEIKPVNISGDFIPDISLLGSSLIFNRKKDNCHIIAKYDIEDEKETFLTAEDQVNKFPRIWKDKIFFLRYDGDAVDLYSINALGEDEKKVMCISEFLDQIE